MSYYIRTIKTESSTSSQVWRIDNNIAVRVGVTNAEQSPGAYFKAEPGESIWDAIRRQTPWFEPNGECPFHLTKRQPGEFYPRMARPIDQHPTESPGWSPGALAEANVIAIALGQLTVLARQLDRICQTVHPTEQTFDTFGHDIRNLLILGCTEVENHWRGVLVANQVNKDKYDTRDYVKLREAMRLDEYAVTFPGYPWLPPLKPFEGWSNASPTQTLKWYSAYNGVKHNREKEFERATLRHAFEAITACVIMVVAQFGLHVNNWRRSELQSFFQFSSLPIWPLSDVYIYPYSEQSAGWSPISFDFGSL
ncbi:hypothetical protein ISG07_04800 [Burkholderia pseudomallei]|nr:hypothetical protein [Burkholderia pseudomallei]